MKNIILFLSMIFVTKLVDDNLPNLHRKNIIKAFDKYITPFILLAYIGFLAVMVKFTKDTEQKKLLLTLTAVVAVAIVIGKALQQEKKQVTV
jgi:hypothetical protein